MPSLRALCGGVRGLCTTTVSPSPSVGRTFLITGANTGIGLATARELARQQGARLVLACRDANKADQAVQQLKPILQTSTATVENVPLDLSDLDSVRVAADLLQQRQVVVDRLILNAGVFSTTPQKTKQGFEMHFGVNHLAHFLFANLLLQNKLLADGARVIVLSSGAAKSGRIQWDDLMCTKTPGQAYPQSKVANTLFALELQRRVRESGQNITAFSVDPGFVNTEIFRGLTPWLKFFATPLLLFAKSPEQGAQGSVHLALAPSESLEPHAGCFFRGRDPVDLHKLPHLSNGDDARRLWALSEQFVNGHKS